MDKLKQFQEHAKEYFKTIDFGPLIQEVKQFAGCNDIQFSEPTLKAENDELVAFVTFESNDVLQHCGILSVTCKEAIINAFGTITSDKRSVFTCDMSFDVNLLQSDSSIPHSVAYLEARYEKGKWDVWKKGYGK